MISQSKEELRAKSNELSKEIYNLRTEYRVTRKIEKPHLIREKKRERARTLTALNQKQG